jgi:hypothetical protein
MDEMHSPDNFLDDFLDFFNFIDRSEGLVSTMTRAGSARGPSASAAALVDRR